MNNHLIFNSSIGSQKPNSLLYSDTSCPFCERESLTDIIDTDGSIIWLKNKYPTLENTFQTVIIETDECQSELSEYSKEHLYKIITFVLKHWKEMIYSKKYKSVLLFKNHGPLSGGSLRHPHMQIVGLEHIDYQNMIQREQFIGIPIDIKDGVEFNIFKFPRMGFYEFNVIMEGDNGLKTFADNLQIATHYILNHFNRNCSSYNLFFYELDGNTAVKIIPRFPTSPLYIGYSIPQVSNHIENVIEKVKKLYFQHENEAVL